MWKKVDGGDKFAIAVPALTELIFGISIIPRAKQNLLLWSEMKNQFTYYDIRLEDAEKADSIFNKLMGSEVEPRKNFITSRAKFVKDLDI